MRAAQSFAMKGLRGLALGKAVSDHVSREVAIGPSVEVLADPSNRVTLALEARDPLGLPRPRISFKFANLVTRSRT